MKRRWYQFRLRTLFVLLTLAAVITGVVRHVWYVRQQIQFHETKLAACHERQATTSGIRYLSLQIIAALKNDPDHGERERIQQAITSGYLLHAPDISRQTRFTAIKDVSLERERDVARIKAAQLYHEEQVEQYRHSLWRPWLRVVEDHSWELPDTPPAIAP